MNDRQVYEWLVASGWRTWQKDLKWWVYKGIEEEGWFAKETSTDIMSLTVVFCEESFDTELQAWEWLIEEMRWLAEYEKEVDAWVAKAA